MAQFVLPVLNVEFDDGTQVRLVPKARDLAVIERDYHFDLNDLFSMTGFYTLAFATLQRLAKNGGRPAPASVDELIDTADVVPETDDEDPEGKDSVPVLSTG
jgi:hypothetical protein